MWAQISLFSAVLKGRLGPPSAKGCYKSCCAENKWPLFLLLRGSKLRSIELLHLLDFDKKYFRIGLGSDLRRFLVSVCCVAFSSRSRLKNRSFGSEWPLITRADAAEK